MVIPLTMLHISPEVNQQIVLRLIELIFLWLKLLGLVEVILFSNLMVESWYKRIKIYCYFWSKYHVEIETLADKYRYIDLIIYKVNIPRYKYRKSYQDMKKKSKKKLTQQWCRNQESKIELKILLLLNILAFIRIIILY